jgi:nitronate monooxygenase
MKANLDIFSGMKIPAIQAPMFLISGPEMVINACKSGIIGSFPTPNARSTEILEEWLATISQSLLKHNAPVAPWAVNLIVHPSNQRLSEDLALIVKYKPPIVITALGSPKSVVETIHSYGGLVFADVINPTYARKAANAGVDGLVLICAGAGGHTGYLSPFTFMSEIRQWFNGIVVLGGGINSGESIVASQALGADFAYLGTMFIASDEASCQPEYKQMVVEATSNDIVSSDAITGVTANWLKQSLIQAGYDPENMPKKGEVDFTKNGADNKRWKNLWAAGQGVAATTSINSVSHIVLKLCEEYKQALAKLQKLRADG